MKSLKKFLSVTGLTVLALLCCFAFKLEASAKTKTIKLTGTEGKNKEEVAALKKLLEENSKNDKKIVTDLNNKMYRWDDNGRLIGFGEMIHESDYLIVGAGINAPVLEGKISFAAFPELKTLIVDGEVTSLDVSGNTKLTELYCGFNSIDKLDVSSNHELTKLYCLHNNLTSLDLRSNTKLTIVRCEENRLKKLNTGGLTSLKYLNCQFNRISSLDVSSNINLEWLDCSYNSGSILYNSSGGGMTSLDISGCINLGLLHCDHNNLKTLDLSNNTKLEELWCDHNNLTTLDVSNCPNLHYYTDRQVTIIGD